MLQPSTEAGRQGLAALLAAPDRAVLALDYDGTLAPIVADPGQAAPLPGTVEVLDVLARRFGRLAVVTGRAVGTVLELGGLDHVPGLVVLGQYGAQRWCDGRLEESAPDPGLDRARAALASLELPLGAEVEDKGLSLAVHTRRTDEPLLALARLHPQLSRVAGDSGLALHLGRLVAELRPRGQDKGAALRSLLDDRSSVLFAGDDLGDLAAVSEVEAFRRRGGAGLVVCSDSAESPEQLRRGADLVVPGPAGVLDVLGELARLTG